MGQLLIEQQGYMKGKSRHLFWVVLAFLLVSVTLINELLLLQLMNGLIPPEVLPVVLAAAKTAVLSGGWLVILLVYALMCNVKSFKVLFFVLALMQLPAAAGGYIKNLYTIELLTGFLDTWINYWPGAFQGLATVLVVLNRLAWAMCLIVFACNKWSGVALRVAAAVFAVYFVFSVVDVMATKYLYQLIALKVSDDLFVTITTMISIMHNLLYLAASGFFFGAMSFGKHRQRKTQAAQSILPV